MGSPTAEHRQPRLVEMAALPPTQRVTKVYMSYPSAPFLAERSRRGFGDLTEFGCPTVSGTQYTTIPSGVKRPQSRGDRCPLCRRSAGYDPSCTTFEADSNSMPLLTLQLLPIPSPY